MLYEGGKFSQIIAQEENLKTTYFYEPIILNLLGATNLSLNEHRNDLNLPSTIACLISLIKRIINLRLCIVAKRYPRSSLVLNK